MCVIDRLHRCIYLPLFGDVVGVGFHNIFGVFFLKVFDECGFSAATRVCLVFAVLEEFYRWETVDLFVMFDFVRVSVFY